MDFRLPVPSGIVTDSLTPKQGAAIRWYSFVSNIEEAEELYMGNFSTPISRVNGLK